MKTERHIFQGEINEFFADKLHGFHNDYVETMLLCGVDNLGTPLDEIKMTKNPNHDMPFYKRLVGGFLTLDPSVFSCGIDQNGELLAEMFFTYLNNGKDVRGVFLLQNVYHWESPDYYCSQVWSLKTNSLTEINNYWLSAPYE